MLLEDLEALRIQILCILSINSGAVTLSPDNLPYSVYSGSAVIVDGTIYYFGGADWKVANQLNKWMKYQCGTDSPTFAPSSLPPTSPPSVCVEESLTESCIR